jgi:hypothetical protein
MKASDTKEARPQNPFLSPPPARRAYEKPAVTELGDIREITLGFGGSNFDLNKTKRN